MKNHNRNMNAEQLLLHLLLRIKNVSISFYLSSLEILTYNNAYDVNKHEASYKVISENIVY